jgi:hypothetical protein
MESPVNYLSLARLASFSEILFAILSPLITTKYILERSMPVRLQYSIRKIIMAEFKNREK